jgi:glutaredoxin
VLEAAKRLDAKLDTKNIQEDPQALKELMTLTGKTQVPCLVVDGNPMLESEDIIKWLERNIAP